MDEDKIGIDRDGVYEDEYEPTESEDEFSEEEKELLTKSRKGKRHVQETVMDFDDDSDQEEEADDDDDNGDLMGDSDIEGAANDGDEDNHDPRYWGKDKRNYYNADFVDPDFSSYTAEQEELAKMEEEEAKNIQMRLLKKMKDADFGTDEEGSAIESDEGEDNAEKADKMVTIKADFSGLSKQEKLKLFLKDSPEFMGLVNEFKIHMHEVESLLQPVLRYVKEHDVPLIPALKFAELYQNLALTYCSNLSFYLLLKAKRVSIKKHPTTKRLLELRSLLAQLKDKYENIIQPQLEALLERIEDGDEFQVLEDKPKTAAGAAKRSNKKQKLSILDEYAEEEAAAVAAAAPSKRRKLLEGPGVDEEAVRAQGAVTDSEDSEGDDDDGADVAAEGDDNEEEDVTRRGITYQIAKNKGLKVHRKKEQRNPRVKHRNKFRKALVRRKGAVRTVRKETKRYGGEISGIKASVSKSIKFKV